MLYTQRQNLGFASSNRELILVIFDWKGLWSVLPSYDYAKVVYISDSQTDSWLSVNGQTLISDDRSEVVRDVARRGYFDSLVWDHILEVWDPILEKGFFWIILTLLCSRCDRSDYWKVSDWGDIVPFQKLGNTILA